MVLGAAVTAGAIVFKPQGLRRWGWFRQAMDAGHIDRRVLLQEATSEVLLHRALGFTGEECMKKAEAALRAQYRPQYDVKGGYPSQVSLSHTDEPRGSHATSDDSDYGNVGRYLREHLTDRQWDLLTAKADLGSSTEAAAYCGSDKSTVARAARRARHLIEVANPGVLHHEMMITDHITPAATEAAGSNTSVKGEVFPSAGRRSS